MEKLQYDMSIMILKQNKLNSIFSKIDWLNIIYGNTLDIKDDIILNDQKKNSPFILLQY